MRGVAGPDVHRAAWETPGWGPVGFAVVVNAVRHGPQSSLLSGRARQLDTGESAGFSVSCPEVPHARWESAIRPSEPGAPPACCPNPRRAAARMCRLPLFSALSCGRGFAPPNLKEAIGCSGSGSRRSWSRRGRWWRLTSGSAYKRGATRLGFALMLKFFEIEARFPRHAGEYPPAAVVYMARQVGVDPAGLVDYEWVGRTVEYHRAQIRRFLGFRRFGEDDEAKLAGWLADEVAPVEFVDEQLR